MINGSLNRASWKIDHLLTTASYFVCRKRSIQASAQDDDTHSDSESAGALHSPETMPSRKRNSKGLVCLRNGNVAMRNLDLASRIPTKTRDDDAAKMFNAKLPLTKAFSLFTMMAYGPRLPIEKARDESHRRILLRSAAPYALSMESLETILAADRDELTAYEIGLMKNAQQIFKYTLPGLLGNYMNEQVFTPRGVYPADDVKMHLGLTGAHAQMSFMNL
jgi:hypothetical protein